MMSSGPVYRSIVALDIERSTSRPDPVEAELRTTIYELFEAALSRLEPGSLRVVSTRSP